jgi:putative membrane protein
MHSLLPYASLALAVAVALEHAYILALEMFWWQGPRGLRVFRMSPAQAEATAVLAKNQGLYNGFLAAGLAWSLFAGPELALPLRRFFGACVFVAGFYGGLTVHRRVFVIQGLPGLLLLLASL